MICQEEKAEPEFILTNISPPFSVIIPSKMALWGRIGNYISVGVLPEDEEKN
jgi:hypothetical protein